MAETRRIRTPWRQRWRRVRYQLLPVLVFAVAGAGAMWLWSAHVGLPNGVGRVEALRSDIVSPVDGTLVQVASEPLELFGTVRAGQVVAQLDDRAARASLEALKGELAQLRKELDATAAKLREEQAARTQDEMREARRLLFHVEELRLAILDRQVLIETDEIEKARLNEKCELVKDLVDEGLESPLALADIERERDVLGQRIESNRKVLDAAEVQKAAREQRVAEFSVTQAADLDTVLAPIREAITAQQGYVKQVQFEVDSLKIRSPITGTVTAIHSWPGQSVVAGVPIAAIASPDRRFIVSYVRQETRIRPFKGMAVDVTVRALPRRTAEARITEVGPQVELVPVAHLRDPTVPEWGLPVRISLPNSLDVAAGELVDLVFKPGATIGATARGGRPASTPGGIRVAEGARPAARTD